MKLLLVEDEKRMAMVLIELLRIEKYDIDHASDGICAMEMIERESYDAIILDVMLPRMSGIEIARRTRSIGSPVPILMLTAKSEVDDKVLGLDSGADDYLTKPFMTKELLARIRALTRRNTRVKSDVLAYGDIELNNAVQQLSCTLTGQSVRLGEKEFKLLEYLMTNQGQILTREQLVIRIWGYESEAEYNNVEVYLSFTRKKLTFVGSKVEIKAVRGVGYELRYSDV